jgi:hypothetical protein
MQNPEQFVLLVNAKHPWLRLLPRLIRDPRAPI